MRRVLKAVYDLLSADERRGAAGILVLMLVTSGFELLGVGSVLPFLRMATDPDLVHSSEVLSAAFVMLGFESVTSFIVFAGVAMIVLIVLMNAVSAVAMWTQLRFVYRVGHSISIRLMGRYLAQPYTYFLAHNTAELGKSILSDTDRIVGGVLKPGAALIARGAVIVAVIVLLVAVEPLITLSTIVVLGGTYAVVYALIRSKLQRIGKESVKANQSRFKTTAEAFGGVKEIKTLGRESYFLRQFRNAAWRLADYEAASRIYSVLPRYLIQAGAFGGFMLGFILLVAAGRDLNQFVPILGFFAFAALRLLPAFQEVLAALADFRFNEHLIFKVHADLVQQEQACPIDKPGDGVPALSFEHHLTLENVWYRYPGAEKDVLRGLTLTVPKNSSIALVGTTGAGKTTVADIILAHLVPQRGCLTVDGIPITLDNVVPWRRQVGYVPQEVFLLDDTIARNIAFGVEDPEIDRNAVEKAARIAHIHDYIVSGLPQGYETVVGERGIRLSGGERQRIGIARALYHDPAVLVLDEATSDIDNVTEAHIGEAIQGLGGRKTLIIIAHRLATIRACDPIFLIEGGEIVASGNYDELVAANTRFQRLARPLGVGAPK